MLQSDSLVSMADGGPEERQCFANLNRSFKRYGSTSNNDSRSPETLTRTILHDLEENDTLQGLALKYGTTMEQIRRANRMYTGDSLFLRGTLRIPVAADSTSASSGLSALSSADSGNSSDSSSPEERSSAILQEARRPSTRLVADPSDPSPTEFLGKIDSSIAHTKSQVNKFNSRSNFLTEEEVDSVSRPRRRPCVSRLRPHSSETDPQLMNSLKKLEQSQDAIFEL